MARYHFALMYRLVYTAAPLFRLLSLDMLGSRLSHVAPRLVPSLYTPRFWDRRVPRSLDVDV